jgi:SET domain-containing protein
MQMDDKTSAGDNLTPAKARSDGAATWYSDGMIVTDNDLPDEFKQLIASGVRPGDLYMASSSLHGKGIFAARAFTSGAIIEICPAIIVPAAQLAALDTTVVFDHYYQWEGAAAVALGFGSLYNHSYEPNALYKKHIDRDLVIVLALKSIADGEEITINYNGDPESQTQVWYEAEGS